MSQYFIQWKGTQRGPFTGDEIAALIKSGEIGSLHTVRHGVTSLTAAQFMESFARSIQEASTEIHLDVPSIDASDDSFQHPFSMKNEEEIPSGFTNEEADNDGIMVYRDGREIGHFTLDKIQTGLISGRFQNTDTIWDAQSGGWVPVSGLMQKEHPSPPKLLRAPSNQSSEKGVLIAGYTCAATAVLFIPLLSGLIAFLCGIYAIIKGKAAQGIAIVILAILGTAIGIGLSEKTAQSIATHEMDLPSLREFVKPAVVQINALDSRGRVVATGSGFFVEPGFVITNYHVVEGAHDVSFTFDDHSKSACDGVLSLDSKRDLAILRPTKSPMKRLEIKDDFPPREGDRVAVIGSPLGFEGTLSDGIVSALREDNGVSFIQITAAISPGSSGSPVVNTRGQVIGIATMIYEGGQSLNFAVSSSELSKALKTAAKQP